MKYVKLTLLLTICLCFSVVSVSFIINICVLTHFREYSIVSGDLFDNHLNY